MNSYLMPTSAPEGFADRFIRDGWRGIERYYGARTPVALRWIAECGGLDRLKQMRREYLRGQRAEIVSIPTKPVPLTVAQAA